MHRIRFSASTQHNIFDTDDPIASAALQERLLSVGRKRKVLYTFAYIAHALFLQLPHNMFIKQEAAAPGSRKRMLPVSTTQQPHSTKRSERLSSGASVAIVKEQKRVKLLQSLWCCKYRFNQTHQVVDKFPLDLSDGRAHRVKSIRCLTIIYDMCEHTLLVLLLEPMIIISITS
jgi:hypothetical protein